MFHTKLNNWIYSLFIQPKPASPAQLHVFVSLPLHEQAKLSAHVQYLFNQVIISGTCDVSSAPIVKG